MSTKQLTLVIPEGIHRDLKRLAAEEGKAIKDLVVEWFREKLYRPRDEIPNRAFSPDEIEAIIAQDDRETKENPDLVKWAHGRAKKAKRA